MLDESIRDMDWKHKLSSKFHADKQRNATFNPVVPGDKVLLKNTKSSGKLAPNFEPRPYTVQTKEGQELTLKADDGTVYRRNSSFVKPIRLLESQNLLHQRRAPKKEKTQAQLQ